MNSYSIFLTKKPNAAYLISRGLRDSSPWSKDGGEILSIAQGSVDDDDLIPSCYYGYGYYYALVEYRNGPDDSCPEYSLIIC